MEWLSKWKAITQTSPFPLPFNISGSFLFLVPLTAHTSPSQAIHHICHLIPPVLSFLASLPVPHNVLLPSSSQPFYALFCLSSVQGPLSQYLSLFPLSRHTLSTFRCHFPSFFMSFFFFLHLHLWSRLTRERLTELNWSQKDPYKWEHLRSSHFYFWDQCLLCLDFNNLSLRLKAHTSKTAPIIFPC